MCSAGSRATQWPCQSLPAPLPGTASRVPGCPDATPPSLGNVPCSASPSGPTCGLPLLVLHPPRKPRTRPRGPLCTHGPSAPAAGAPHEVWTRMRKTGFWRFTDTSPHDRGEKGSGPVVANEPKGTGDPGTQPLARRPPPGPASAALPEASTKTGVAEGAGWGQGASRPDWPAGRLTAAATTPRGLSRAGETPRACGVCKGRGRGNVECGPWGVGGLGQTQAEKVAQNQGLPTPQQTHPQEDPPQGHAHQVHGSHANCPQGHHRGASTAPAVTWSSAHRAQEQEGEAARPGDTT